jgi:hypothetical protein
MPLEPHASRLNVDKLIWRQVSIAHERVPPHASRLNVDQLFWRQVSIAHERVPVVAADIVDQISSHVGAGLAAPAAIPPAVRLPRMPLGVDVRVRGVIIELPVMCC